jgi:hypothetical protein
MKKLFGAIFLTCLTLISISSPAESALSPNLVSDSDFATNTLTSPGNVSVSIGLDKWYATPIANNDNQNGLYYYSSSGDPLPSVRLRGDGVSGTIYQLMDRIPPSQSTPYLATKGDVQVTFNYLNDAVLASGTVKLFGYTSQPNFGQLNTANAGGVEIFTETFTTAEKAIHSGSNWATWSSDVGRTALAGYNFYSIWVSLTNGTISGNQDAFTFVDNFSVKVTPIPAAAWLLGSGLIGLVAIRRRSK